MALLIILLILILLGLGFYAGFRFGSLHIAKENDTLRNQLSLQEHFSRNWAAEATDKYQLSTQLAREQTTNLATTMHTVIQLLHTVEREQSHTLNKEEQQKISTIINQAKQIASP
jgi:uncharacterized protein HemX